MALLDFKFMSIFKFKYLASKKRNFYAVLKGN